MLKWKSPVLATLNAMNSSGIISLALTGVKMVLV
jgi:hypothetical protein